VSDIAIRVDGLGKQYRIGTRERYHSLRDSLSRAVTRLFRPTRDASQKPSADTIWALKDVSFEVQRGEVVGIIGRNGAGKSTLLKVLSRITEPTEGTVELHGRVGSLLEVGTGFHPELTGRENIYLNGAILGMSRAEIQRKFDEIVAFAEVEKFLDTPIKHYSSGMYMRLAFAVAAHLEPEILLVDEVLAVGDVEFQRKCLGKMEQVSSRQGRTILFVSHNMAAVTHLCREAILLDEGHVHLQGPSAEVIAIYHSRSPSELSGTCDLTGAARSGTGRARFTHLDVQLTRRGASNGSAASPGCDLSIIIRLQAVSDILESNVAAILYDENFYRLVDVNTALKKTFVSLRAGQTSHVTFTLQDVRLKPGLYFLGLWVGRGRIEEIDRIDYAGKVEITDGPEAAQHVEVFPGPYQCRFEASVQVNA